MLDAHEYITLGVLTDPFRMRTRTLKQTSHYYTRRLDRRVFVQNCKLLTCVDATSLIQKMGTESDSDLITVSACIIIMMAAMIRQNRNRRQQDARSHHLFLLSQGQRLFPPPCNIPVKKSSIFLSSIKLLGLLRC